MKKDFLYKLTFTITIVLVILFIVFICIDYSKYDITYSAPFSMTILIRSIEFLLPSLIIFIIANCIRKR